MPMKKRATKKLEETLAQGGYDSHDSNSQSLLIDQGHAAATYVLPPGYPGSSPSASSALVSQAQAHDSLMPVTHTVSKPTSKAATKLGRGKDRTQSPAHTDHVPGDQDGSRYEILRDWRNPQPARVGSSWKKSGNYSTSLQPGTRGPPG